MAENVRRPARSPGPSALPDGALLLQVLKDAVQEVFQAMLGCLPEPAQPEGAASESLPSERARIDREVEVSFHGALAGSIVLRFSAQGALDIARGLLKLEEGQSLAVDEIADAMGECANMIAGTVKTKALDPCGEFSLSVPRLQAARETRNDAQRCGRLAFRLSQGHMAAEIWLANS